MSRALLVLTDDAARMKAAGWIKRAPEGTRVEFKAPNRTLDQNSMLWSLLTQISEQHSYHGLRLSPNDYKLLFMNALTRETRIVPNLDGNGFVALTSSSDLSKQEMSDLIELIFAWCAREGITVKQMEAA